MMFASRIIPTSQRSDESERSESDSPSASPTPAARETTARVQPSTQPVQPDSVQERVMCVAADRSAGTCVRDPSPAPPKKELTLEEENRQLKEARLCKVCMDSEVRFYYKRTRLIIV